MRASNKKAFQALHPHQKIAVSRLRPGSILCGGVGSGKSRTAVAYFVKEYARCRTLLIITTARKRDNHEWDDECGAFDLKGVDVIVDSWNNIGKYVKIKDAFVIFDEQRVVGSGAWVKGFYKIVKRNPWILLSATPGDVWMDYVPVFVANGYFPNKTAFVNDHVVFDRFAKYPKIKKYINTARLERLRKQVLVDMPFARTTKRIRHKLLCDYDRGFYNDNVKRLWDPYKQEPAQNAGVMCYIQRRMVNSDPSRQDALVGLMRNHPKLIVFYNFDYELEMIRETCASKIIPLQEWNGHLHQPVPTTKKWVYAVQYQAGAEAWNCVETDAIMFWSLSYSWKVMEQAEGRIDRLNTPFTDLHYYYVQSESPIDKAIARALRNKEIFNQQAFIEQQEQTHILERN